MSDEKQYSNGDITVVWKPSICQHAAECVKGSPTVFRPKEKPWIDAQGAPSDQIRKTVSCCPSGALTIKEATE